MGLPCDFTVRKNSESGDKIIINACPKKGTKKDSIKYYGICIHINNLAIIVHAYCNEYNDISYITLKGITMCPN